MTATLNGDGYWMVASDGGVFSFNAPFQGSTGSLRLNKPVVGMALDRTTGGYWLVASDGGVFSYNAPFYGSTGSIRLNKPVVSIAPVSDGSGYRLIASDGGVFSYNAPFYGSAGSITLNKPVVGGVEQQLVRRLLALRLRRRSLHLQPDQRGHAVLRLSRIAHRQRWLSSWRPSLNIEGVGRLVHPLDAFRSRPRTGSATDTGFAVSLGAPVLPLSCQMDFRRGQRLLGASRPRRRCSMIRQRSST